MKNTTPIVCHADAPTTLNTSGGTASLDEYVKTLNEGLQVGQLDEGRARAKSNEIPLGDDSTCGRPFRGSYDAQGDLNSTQPAQRTSTAAENRRYFLQSTQTPKQISGSFNNYSERQSRLALPFGFQCGLKVLWLSSSWHSQPALHGQLLFGCTMAK